MLAFVLVLCRWHVCSFLLSLSLDKALHSAGISSGFIIFGTNLTNPLNELLLVLQPVSVFSSFMMKRWLSLIKMRSKSYFLCPLVVNLNEAQCWSTFFFSWLPLNALVILSSKWESEREKKRVRGYALERTAGELWKTSWAKSSYTEWMSHLARYESFDSCFLSDQVWWARLEFYQHSKSSKTWKMYMMLYLFLCATQTVHRCQRMLRRQKLLPAFASTCTISIKLNGICLFFQTWWGQRGGCRSIGRMEPN